MANTVSRILRFFEKEALSCHLIFLATLLNVWAWIIPRGDYRYPSRDILGIQHWVSGQFSDIALLHYFWNGLLAVTVLGIGCSAYKTLIMLIDNLWDHADL